MNKAKKNFIKAMLFLLPALAIILVFRFTPILYALRISFYDWGIAGSKGFVGLENYSNVLQDGDFWHALTNTFWYVMTVVPGVIIFSMAIAVLLNQKIKFKGFFRTTYFLPVVTSIIAISIVWKWIYHPRIGVANYFLQLIGLNPLQWLQEPRGIFEMMFQTELPLLLKGPSLALFSLSIMTVWKSLGYNIIIFLAGLQNIPGHYYESASIDGANKWQSFRHITLPLLSPTTFYVLLMTTIMSFKVFAPVWMMTGPPPGGPLGTTNVIVYYLFDKAFNFLKYGYATAVAFILFVIILTLTVIQKKYGERNVHYE
ncbi:MAG: sugar ABC transporter permease [bacterium]